MTSRGGGWGGLPRGRAAGAAAMFLVSVIGMGTFPGRSRAVDTTYQVADELRAWYDNNKNESLVDNRLDLLVNHGAYTLGGELLSHDPSNPGLLDPSKFGASQEGIRKRWFEAKTKDWSVRVGNVYASFGRGLALQIYEDQGIDFDNPLDGASGEARFGPANLQFIAGTNSYGPAAMVLKGGHVGFDLPGGFKTGFHGVWSDYLDTSGGARTGGDRLYGGLLEKSLGTGFDWYGEYVVRDERTAEGTSAGVPQGHASYTSVNLSLGPAQFLGEFKDLLRFDLPQIKRDNTTLQTWVNPPTAVRQHATTLLNRGSHVANIRLADEEGGLAETYINVTEKTRLTGSFSRSLAHHSYQPAWEAYGELEQHVGETTDLVFRADQTQETVLEVTDGVFTGRITYSASLVAPITDEWSFDTTFETQSIRESHTLTQDFRYPLDTNDQVAILTVSKAPNLSWAVTGEWTNDQRENRQTWLWLEWDLQLGTRHHLVVGGGSLRGGQVCSGGVCKIVDPFQGGSLELQTTF